MSNRKSDILPPQQIRISPLGRVTSQPWEAVLHFTNSQQEKEIMKSGIDLILGDYPTYLATEF
jgi:hypothetical protein